MQRINYLEHIETAFRTSRVVILLGPRQCGKTTLARQFFRNREGPLENYFDLENPVDLLRLQDPLLALETLQNLIIIDEVQRIPQLFPILRVLVDRENSNQHFLILGSASRELIQQTSESLAGRAHYVELTPFSFEETAETDKLWLRGGFPPAYLAKTDQDSERWRRDYIRTFLEQDIPALGIKLAPQNLRRFWMMISHYHGQLFNASEIGNALDFSHNTAQKYLDILTGTFMVRQLHPWHENIAKRQVKSKKIYLRDSGIFHTLLNIPDRSSLQTHPKLGASWEGFALESIIRHLQAQPEECYFWGIHAQAELDLLVVQGSRRQGFEFKFTKTPALSKSMKLSLELLQLEKLTVIYPGDVTIRLTPQITCEGLEHFLER